MEWWLEHRHGWLVKRQWVGSVPGRVTRINTKCLAPLPFWPDLILWALIQYKMSSYQYRKSHCGDKTVVRSSYLHNGISYTGKMSYLYWIGALVYWEPFSWLTSVGTNRNTVIRLGRSRIGLDVLNLHEAGVGLKVGLQSSVVTIINATHYSYRTTMHTFHHCNTHAHFHANAIMQNWSWEMIMGSEALCAGHGRRNPVWSGKGPIGH